MQSKQEQGHHYRVQTLRLLARLGYASTRQVARAVWGACTLSTRKMASRTIRWLFAAGYVVSRRDRDSVNGERLIALSAAGAEKLAEWGTPLMGGKAHARDWLRHAHAHRTACNAVFSATAGERDSLDDVGWSELEIRNGTAPAELSSFPFTADGQDLQKIPDLLLKRIDGVAAPVWVEVENTWRSAKDLQKAVSFMRAMFRQPAPPASLILFVITAPGASSIGRRLAAALGPGDPHTDGRSRPLRELDAHILAKRISVLELDQGTLTFRRVPISLPDQKPAEVAKAPRDKPSSPPPMTH